MSIRSRIAVLQENGSVKSVFCHWDGYLRWVGKILLNHYNTYEKANELVALGDLYSLHENINPLPEAPEARPQKDTVEILTTHSVDRPQKGVTIANLRDGKKKFEQQVNRSLKGFYKNGDFQRYNYLFKDGQWYVMSYYVKENEWVKLTQEMIELEKNK